MKHTRELFWHYWLPVLLMLILIRGESTGTMSGENTARWLAVICRHFGLPLRTSLLDFANLVLRKCGHACGYGLLGLCWFWLMRGAYWLQHDYKSMLRSGRLVARLCFRPLFALLAIGLTFSVAAADELHQMSLADRTGTWWDVLLDTAAATVFMLILGLVSRLRCALSARR